MRRLAVVAVFAVACGSASAQAQTLTLAFTKGDVHKYALHVSGNFTINAGFIVEAVKVDLTAHESLTVQSVASDGTADVTVALTDVNLKTSTAVGSGTSTTTTTTTTSIPPQQLKIAPDGRILSVNGTSLSGASPFGSMLGGELVFAVFPDHAVKAGDTWSKTYDQAGTAGMGGTHVTSTSTYLRDETFHGVNAAVIETKSTAEFSLDFSKMSGLPIGPPATSTTGPQGSASMKGKVTSDVTSWIDPAAHRILKSLMTGKLDATFTLVSAEGSTSPVNFGPISIQGTQSLDLEPA